MSDQTRKAYEDLVQPTPEQSAEIYTTRVRLREKRRQRRREKLISAAIEATEIALIIFCSAVIGYLFGVGGLI